MKARGQFSRSDEIRVLWGQIPDIVAKAQDSLSATTAAPPPVTTISAIAPVAASPLAVRRSGWVMLGLVLRAPFLLAFRILILPLRILYMAYRGLRGIK